MQTGQRVEADVGDTLSQSGAFRQCHVDHEGNRG